MNDRPLKLIYLLGFMGSGKSSVGALLAEELAWPFIDLDMTIEAGQGASIREIFEQAGEPFFRQLEQAALVEVSRKERAIIALGGGTFVQKANFDFIRERGGVTIWLDSPLEELWQRCATMDNRPLFQDREGARRGGHQQAISARNQAFDIARVRVRMTAGHVMLFADFENAAYGIGHDGMLIISRMAELLAQIAFADQDNADAGNLFEDSRQVIDGARIFALNDH